MSVWQDKLLADLELCQANHTHLLASTTQEKGSMLHVGITTLKYKISSSQGSLSPFYKVYPLVGHREPRPM